MAHLASGLILRSGTAILAMVSAMNAGMSAANESAGASSSSDPYSEPTIVVTGSRLEQSLAYRAVPVRTIGAEDIQQSGHINLTDYLVDVPALQSSYTSVDSAGSGMPTAGMVGVNFLNLRNLGHKRTLVLVDGKRHVGGFAGSAAVDITNIPTSLVQQVDVLTGGVSAVYGADAVSGVVNFVMKRDFEGLTLNAQNRISERGDAAQTYVAATYGKSFGGGRGNIALAYEFQQEDQLGYRKRLNHGQSGPRWEFAPNPLDGPQQSGFDDPQIVDFLPQTGLRWLDVSPAGAIALGSPFDHPDENYLFIPPAATLNGDGEIYDSGRPIFGTSLTIGGSGTLRERFVMDILPESRRHLVNALAYHEFSQSLTVRADVKYVSSHSRTDVQPTTDLFTYLAPDNFYLNNFIGEENSVGGAMISRDNLDFGPRYYKVDRELWRGVLSADGAISDHLRYEASLVVGQSRQASISAGDRIVDRYYAALDAVDDGNGGVTCRVNLPDENIIYGLSVGNRFPMYESAPLTFAAGDCVPLNLIGEGSPSQEALDFVLATHRQNSRLRQTVANMQISGDSGGFFQLPGGPVAFALGAEYRKESSRSTPSYYGGNDLLVDQLRSVPTGGSFDVSEFFAEVQLPLLADAPLADHLSVGGAVRVSDYSTSGTSTTWNVSGAYAPVRDVLFRASYSRSVRAPNIGELMAPNESSIAQIFDPCGVDKIGTGTADRAANCDAALTALGLDPAEFDPSSDVQSPQYMGAMGSQIGNRDLSPEKSKSWTVGLTMQPKALGNFSLTVDWYDIRLKRAIRTATAQELVDLCYDLPQENNPFCGLLGREETTGNISYYSLKPQNVASLRTAGLDLDLQYQIVLGQKLGQLQWRLAGNYLDHLSYTPADGAPKVSDRDNIYAPRYSANFDVTWMKGDFAIRYGIDWRDKTRRVTKAQLKADPDYVDARYIWYRETWEHDVHLSKRVGQDFEFYGGVTNLWDRKPDIGALSYPISAVGRSFYTGLKAKFF